MSIDDGICILKSKRRGGGFEYRVRHFFVSFPVAWRDPYVAWPEDYTLADWEAGLRKQFDGSLVFLEWDLAQDEARRLEAHAVRASPWGQPENDLHVLDIGREFPAVPRVAANATNVMAPANRIRRRRSHVARLKRRIARLTQERDQLRRDQLRPA